MAIFRKTEPKVVCTWHHTTPFGQKEIVVSAINEDAVLDSFTEIVAKYYPGLREADFELESTAHYFEVTDV